MKNGAKTKFVCKCECKKHMVKDNDYESRDSRVPLFLIETCYLQCCID